MLDKLVLYWKRWRPKVITGYLNESYIAWQCQVSTCRQETTDSVVNLTFVSSSLVYDITRNISQQYANNDHNAIAFGLKDKLSGWRPARQAMRRMSQLVLLLNCRWKAKQFFEIWSPNVIDNWLIFRFTAGRFQLKAASLWMLFWYCHAPDCHQFLNFLNEKKKNCLLEPFSIGLDMSFWLFVNFERCTILEGKQFNNFPNYFIYLVLLRMKLSFIV